MEILPFGLATATKFLQPSLNLYCSFAITRVSVLLSIWMIFWSWFTLNGKVRGLTHICVLYWFALDYILIFPGLTFPSLRPFVFFGLCWVTVHMSVSLPPNTLANIQQLTLSLLQTQPLTIHQVMSFLVKTNFVPMATPSCRDCVVSFRVIHLFSSVHFSFSVLCLGEQSSHLQQTPVPLQFPLPDVVIATYVMSTWAFYFQGSGLPLSVSGSWSGSMCRAHIALWELQAVVMMLHRMAFNLFGKAVALYLDNSTAKAYLCNQGG